MERLKPLFPDVEAVEYADDVQYINAMLQDGWIYLQPFAKTSYNGGVWYGTLLGWPRGKERKKEAQEATKFLFGEQPIET